LKWRDAAAVRKDVPPFKILGNHQVMGLVEKKPSGIKELAGLSPKQINRFGKDILEAIQTALTIPDNKLPVFPKIKRPRQNAVVLKKIHMLKQWRDRYGKDMGLDPSIICPNSLIQSITNSNACTIEELKGLAEMRKWQADLFGEEICRLLTCSAHGAN
jgi:ribonuclease D